MNQNKLSTKRIRVVVAIISVAIIWWLHMLYALPGSDGSNMSCDAINGYAVDIDTEFVTDWHSALFGYEGIAFKRIALFFDITLNGLEFINIAAIVAISISLVSFLYLTLKFSKKWWNCLILSAFYFVVFYFNGVHEEWRHDHLFLYLLFPLAAGVVALYCSHNRHVKIILIFLIVLLLWHCVEFRKNSMVIVPIVIGAVFVCLNKRLKFGSVKNIIRIAMYSFCFMGIVFCVNFVMPVIKTYPISPMLISDVRIAHIMHGKLDCFFENNMVTRCKECDYKIGGHWHVIHDKNTCLVCDITDEKNSLHSASPYSLYVESLKVMPFEMIIAKSIQIAQLYRLDAFPVSIERVLKSIYPHAFEDKRVFYPCCFSKRDMLKIWGTFLMLLITAYYSVKRIKKRGVKNREFDLFHIFIAALALVYAASFVIATPTPDYRYLMPSICLGQIVLMCWIISFLGEVCENNILSSHSSVSQT